MPAIPANIEGIGDSSAKPRPNPEFDPTQSSALTSEDFYVFSRIDGTASVKDLILMIGLGVDRSIEILRKLRAAGAFLLDGERPDDVRLLSLVPEDQAPGAEAKGAKEGDFSMEELMALAETVALRDDEKIVVVHTMRAVRTGDLYAILGVDAGADKRSIKRAYFEFSKRFHPDRYYGKDTGSFGPWLSEIFAVATKAWNTLSDERRRASYDSERGGGSGARTQTKEEHAAELYARASQEEGQGRFAEALALFRGAISSDENPRYVRRAAACAIKAGALEEAEELARRAVALRTEDPSYWRVLADVLRALGRLADAVEVLELAAGMRTENDVLATEIARDLDAVRRQLAQG